MDAIPKRQLEPPKKKTPGQIIWTNAKNVPMGANTEVYRLMRDVLCMDDNGNPLTREQQKEVVASFDSVLGAGACKECVEETRSALMKLRRKIKEGIVEDEEKSWRPFERRDSEEGGADGVRIWQEPIAEE